MGAKNKFHGLYQKESKQAAAVKISPKNKVQEKSEVEIMRSQIQKTLRDNPEMAKKAAMIIERMLGNPNKK